MKRENQQYFRVFEELSNEGNGLVYYDKLQERLVFKTPKKQ